MHVWFQELCSFKKFCRGHEKMTNLKYHSSPVLLHQGKTSMNWTFKNRTIKFTHHVQEVHVQCDFSVFYSGLLQTSSTDLSFRVFFTLALWCSLKTCFHPLRALSGLVVSDCCPFKASHYITNWSWMVAMLKILAASRVCEGMRAQRSYFCVCVCACGSVPCLKL